MFMCWYGNETKIEFNKLKVPRCVLSILHLGAFWVIGHESDVHVKCSTSYCWVIEHGMKHVNRVAICCVDEFCDTDADKEFGLWGIPFDISSTNSVAGTGSWFSDGRHCFSFGTVVDRRLNISCFLLWSSTLKQ